MPFFHFQRIFEALMRLKTIILEDSRIERDELFDICSQFPEIDLVNSFTNINQAREYLKNFSVDLILSDIMMDGGTGLDFVRGLEVQPAVVLISSHTEFAIDAFELNVIDFIAKPVSLDRFTKAFNRVKEYFELKKVNANNVQDSLSVQDDYIFVKESGNYVKVKFADIAYMESMGNFTRIHLVQDKRYVTLVGLKYMLEQLPPALFSRIHRSYIINVNHLKSFSPDEVIVNGNALPIGKSFRDDFMSHHIISRLVSPKNQGQETD